MANAFASTVEAYVQLWRIDPLVGREESICVVLTMSFLGLSVFETSVPCLCVGKKIACD